jgi:formylglycine-generating enzyme required for sulfatase activity
VRRVRRVRCGAQVHGCGAQVRQVRGTAAIVVLALTFACAQAPSGPPTWVEPTTGMTFVQIPAGEFVMGSPASEPGHQENERQHRVRLTRAVLFGIREVTEREWNALISPGAAATLPDRPVVNVTWTDVQAFIARLNRLGHGRFRLPTEAEWEYACRAGTTTAYHVGDLLTTDQANYNGEFPLPGQATGQARGGLVDAGSFTPNPWGLHDMHGNAWEWTADAFCNYRGDAVDPTAACDAPLKSIRGGSWRFNADSARCALRYTHRPEDRGDSLGFRLVREID